MLLAHDRIALTQDQQDALHALVEKTVPHSNELQAKLQSEVVALSALANQDHVDEAAVNTQLDKVLDVERELKHLHISLLVAIKNLLAPEQQAKMRELTKDGGAQFEDDTRKRLTAKVEQVKEGMQKWADSGRDPSDIGKAMADKFKPLMDAGKVVEAEAELDSLLTQLNEDSK